MSEPIRHIKDAYFFEVPKFLTQGLGISHYNSLDEVPEFIREDHPHASLHEINDGMAGKILIPQVFGAKLDNLYTTKSGFGISKFMILEVIVAIILIVLFTRVANRMRVESAPKGRIWNLMESFLVYLRDEVIRPSIDGEHHDEHADASHSSDGHASHHGASNHGHAHSHKRDSDRFLPMLWTIFFFVLGCNLMGILPWMGSPTGAFATTLTLAVVVFLVGIAAGMMKLGPLQYWVNQAPKIEIELPGGKLMQPVSFLISLFMMFFIFVIEVGGSVIKHIILGFRLLANMVAGHLVILGIMSLIAGAATLSMGSWSLVTVLACVGTTLFFCLELFVAFLQAYLFTFLASLFIGAGLHQH